MFFNHLAFFFTKSSTQILTLMRSNAGSGFGLWLGQGWPRVRFGACAEHPRFSLKSKETPGIWSLTGRNSKPPFKKNASVASKPCENSKTLKAVEESWINKAHRVGKRLVAFGTTSHINFLPMLTALIYCPKAG